MMGRDSLTICHQLWLDFGYTHHVAEEKHDEDPVTTAAEQAQHLGRRFSFLWIGRGCCKDAQVQVIGAH